MVAQMKISFNINDNVRVRLTPHGHAIYRKNHDELYIFNANPNPYRAPTEDADGWSTWQLWDLMSHFGASMHNGCKLPFETEIKIVTPNGI
jgi:hypothetical protein